ncbi:hypothetical protein NHP190012_15960 [Helicobacter sp. NHP19-012]|uniref:Tellurite resistance protein TerB n=1 Tax=Helicobacter gastrofelis TaxID=2849642 RepID=A0ABM7SJ00_9HELI|nr:MULTISPECIES: hypothetical protein [unclassified Helicobacter]BCZ19954.1 hypothetical protein NHP190012_15960 [Helicobacter sp. NHP19-012]GMB95619.1 hypothetical protein NHP22001_02080 [Helicobacter sp. NHP22-001]
MFLGALNAEEKKAFLQIAHHFAWSNDDFSDAQKEVIATYCLEMQIEDIDYKADQFDLKATLGVFKQKEHQKIVLLETMALAMADRLTHLEALHEGERAVLDTMIQSFGLKPNLARIYADWTKAMLVLTDQGKNLIAL